MDMDIFTIGYEGLDQRVFLALLRHHNVSVVADVRHLPLSRKKGFSKTALNNTLKENKIEYLNFPELGTSKEMRNFLKTTGNYTSFFSEYKKEIQEKDDSVGAINEMVQSGEQVALLCFERDAQKCHRKILADVIKLKDGNGLKIKHIEPI
jgi:uncharacterized protein (DUF488 family)